MSDWIYLPDNRSDVNVNEVVYFRRVFLANETDRLVIRIAAEHRYELYFNGVFIGRGPVRGRRNTSFFDMYDLSGRIAAYTNRLAVRLVRYATAFPRFEGRYGPTSVLRNAMGGLVVDGRVVSAADGTETDIGTSSDWEAKKEEGIASLAPRRAIWATNTEEHFGELIDHDFFGCRSTEGWQPAAVICDSLLGPHAMKSYGQTYSIKLQPAPIPLPAEVHREFLRITKSSNNMDVAFPLTVPPDSELWFDMDAGEMTTAFPQLDIAGGKGAAVSLTYSESYYANPGTYVKSVRDDISGELAGEIDLFHSGGGKQRYSTFIYRTFRFIRVAVRTKGESLVIQGLTYLETGYPLEVIGTFKCDVPIYNELFDISLRTLRRCMHDTYVDCPYYEQLQYVLDTRLEALFAYFLSNDDRLARRAFEDFTSTLGTDGLIDSRAPSAYPQRIPSFALHFIFMLHDHMMFFGDKALLLGYLPVIDAILTYFLRHQKENGLICTQEAWGFIDWVDGWRQDSVPLHGDGEGMTVLSEMAAYAFDRAAEMAEYCGRNGLAGEYRDAAVRITASVNRNCHDAGKRLYADGDGMRTYSEHAQIWAVLCGAAQGADAKRLFEEMEKHNLGKTSYAHSFFRFRALEKADVFPGYRRLLKEYIDMTSLHLTTWLEDAVTQRSDCHGWGSVPIYELMGTMGGIRPASPGFTKAIVRPVYDPEISRIEGKVPTGSGLLSVDIEYRGGAFLFKIDTPIPVEAHLPDGRIENLPCGGYVLNGKMKARDNA